MAPKVDDKEPLDFVSIITVDEWKDLIRGCVAEVAQAHRELMQALAHPRPLSDADKKMLGITPGENISTVHLAKARLQFWEDTQDRLWHWYRKLNDNDMGEAPEAGSSGK